MKKKILVGVALTLLAAMVYAADPRVRYADAPKLRLMRQLEVPRPELFQRPQMYAVCDEVNGTMIYYVQVADPGGVALTSVPNGCAKVEP